MSICMKLIFRAFPIPFFPHSQRIIRNPARIRGKKKKKEKKKKNCKHKKEHQGKKNHTLLSRKELKKKNIHSNIEDKRWQHVLIHVCVYLCFSGFSPHGSILFLRFIGWSLLLHPENYSHCQNTVKTPLCLRESWR